MRDSIPTADYHSALKDPVTAPAMARWEGDGTLAFVHDLMSTPVLPAEYARCDVIVADLPWQTGFTKFNNRAGVPDKGRTYAAFMRRISEIVDSTGVTMYLVTGKHALPKLPAPDVTLPMMLNQDAALAIGYQPGDEAGRTYSIAQEFLYALALQYRKGGDFCCGYGRTGRFFVRAGKSVVLSDYNASCIGYISQHAAEWAPR